VQKRALHAVGEGKFMRQLSKKQRKDVSAPAAMRDSEIDLGDRPEVLDWSKAEVGRFCRKKKATSVQADRKKKWIR